ncbi:hypothetical protein BYT27DRAFT_6690414 [Phlegmacium glaucopus]|nr:hypothetical protein BYT27DRAFT_6690414 [Phlegmacium glaucopus]
MIQRDSHGMTYRSLFHFLTFFGSQVARHDARNGSRTSWTDIRNVKRMLPLLRNLKHLTKTLLFTTLKSNDSRTDWMMYLIPTRTTIEDLEALNYNSPMKIIWKQRNNLTKTLVFRTNFRKVKLEEFFMSSFGPHYRPIPSLSSYRFTMRCHEGSSTREILMLS